MDVKLKDIEKNDNKEFRLQQNLSVEESDFNQFLRVRNQMVIVAQNFGREQKISPLQIPALSKDIDQQPKLPHGVVDILDCPKGKLCATMLHYNVDKPEISFAQVQFFARKEEEERLQQIVYVNYKLDDFIYLLDVMKFVFDKKNC